MTDLTGYFVYMVRCADRSLYTGWTTEVQRRVREHNDGLASKYTRARLPVSLVYLEQLESRSDALKREYAIKQLSRQKKEEIAGIDP
jgi:putative endonuclease